MPDSHARTLTQPAAIDALNHPIRRQVLGALREADSAANVARLLGLPRQKVNYHMKELARAELVKEKGERRKGHLIEKLYEAVAGSFVISPRIAVDEEKRQRALNDQVSLRHLVMLGEQLQQDAIGLLDRAAFDEKQIASASVEAEVHFPDEASRTAFMQEYLQLLGPLLEKYGSENGEKFKTLLSIYPDPENNYG